jgi:hypothetical protein
LFWSLALGRHSLAKHEPREHGDARPLVLASPRKAGDAAQSHPSRRAPRVGTRTKWRHVNIRAFTTYSTMTISVADFKIHRAICEIRYEDAYLLFDRTGRVLQEMKNGFTELNVIEATPTKTTARSTEGAFALELRQSRVSAENPDSNLDAFTTSSKRFFDIVVDSLEVKVFTRIGLRLLFRKDLQDLHGAKKDLDSLRLINLPPQLRYEAADQPEEVMFRWQSDQVGAMLRLKAEKGTIDVILPPELESAEPKIHKSYTGLVLDVDYYTVAPVERSQWDPSSWIQQSARIVRRDTDKIFAR